VGFACDDCCGHGNEDGWCKPIAEAGQALLEKHQVELRAKDDEHQAHILAMKDFVCDWLIRARLALYREGWEEGMSVRETTEALSAVLSNLGCDDGTERPADIAATKRLLAKKPRYHLPIDGLDLLERHDKDRQNFERLYITACKGRGIFRDAYRRVLTALTRLKELANYHQRDIGEQLDLVLTVIDEGLGHTEEPSTLGAPLTDVDAEQLHQACANIGYDITCGACAELFFTGVCMHPHDPSCTTTPKSNGSP
jgi:hypothetical protein